MELDAVIGNGYADNVAKNFEGAIEQTYQHDKWASSGIGTQQFFRIDLTKASQIQ